MAVAEAAGREMSAEFWGKAEKEEGRGKSQIFLSVYYLGLTSCHD